MPAYTEKDSRIQVTIPAAGLNSALFSSFSGGDTTVATEWVYPGNAQPGQQAVGLETVGDVTLTVPVTDQNVTWSSACQNAVGSTMNVSVTALDGDHNPITGTTEGRTGYLKTATPPPGDAASSTAKKLTLVFAPNPGLTIS